MKMYHNWSDKNETKRSRPPTYVNNTISNSRHRGWFNQEPWRLTMVAHLWPFVLSLPRSRVNQSQPVDAVIVNIFCDKMD